MDKQTRLAVYGSLAPGQINHHQLASLQGTWQWGEVIGALIPTGWGVGLGFPGLILDPLGEPQNVDLFESPDLPAHWARLDEFEGPDYQRTETTVKTAQGKVTACIYVLAEP